MSPAVLSKLNIKWKRKMTTVTKKTINLNPLSLGKKGNCITAENCI